MFPFSCCCDFVVFIFWRKQNIYWNGAFSFRWYVINKWHWLVYKKKNQALWNLHKWCKCCAAARNESAKRCDNFTRCPQHHYLLTRHWRTEAACAQYLTALAPLSSALFCIGTRMTRTLAHPLPAKHGLLTERFSKPNVRFASATHAYALHAHSKPRCYGRRGRAKGANLCDFPRRFKKCRSVIWHYM